MKFFNWICAVSFLSVSSAAFAAEAVDLESYSECVERISGNQKERALFQYNDVSFVEVPYFDKDGKAQGFYLVSEKKQYKVKAGTEHLKIQLAPNQAPNSFRYLKIDYKKVDYLMDEKKSIFEYHLVDVSSVAVKAEGYQTLETKDVFATKDESQAVMKDYLLKLLGQDPESFVKSKVEALESENGANLQKGLASLQLGLRSCYEAFPSDKNLRDQVEGFLDELHKNQISTDNPQKISHPSLTQ